jgi:glycerol kinase
MARFVLAADCGTTSVRSLAFDIDSGRHQVCASEQLPLSFPRPGWVEIDPEMVAEATVRVVRAAFEWVARAGGTATALGLTNMRETAFAWQRSTQRPVYPGIMWMSQQSEPVVDEWRAANLDGLIRSRTGLTNHSFFFGSKVAWLLRTEPEAKKLADQGDLAVGTLDSWLLYRLSGGAAHATDVSNGSRYQLMNLETLAWDDELCTALGVPRSTLPDIRSSEGYFATTDPDVCGQEVPITGIVADQQASLLGHGCENRGDVKATFGTSGVVALNAGPEATLRDGLVTSVAWQDHAGQSCYELEGSAFHSGYTVGWLTQRFGDAAARPSLRRSHANPRDRVYVLPSFTEMGAPRWPTRRGAVITGLGMDTGVEEITAAAVEAMAFQAYDLFAAMGDVGGGATEVVVDGGGAANDELCQMLADLFDREVVRPDNQELTSVGAAKAALRGAGEEAPRYFGQDRSRARRFRPGQDATYARGGYEEWVRLVETVLQPS